MRKLSKTKIEDEIKQEAKVLGLHAGTATLIAKEVAPKVLNWSKRRAVITENDLNMRLAKELEEYNKDLAYLFKERGRII